ncbi:interferon a3-like [Heptranchias perlo]|uniref:interferon a3-like n=1 Tax=Heptranchias perlo TaxID=212740 RepID=UPI00355A1CCB
MVNKVSELQTQLAKWDYDEVAVTENLAQRRIGLVLHIPGHKIGEIGTLSWLNMAHSCIWIFGILSVLLALSLGCERLPQLYLNSKTLNNLNEMAEDKILVIHQTLDQINKIFSENLSSAPWDFALLEGFLQPINRQLEELRECQREPLSHSKNEEIREYFGKLREFLELERFGDCAWKVVCSRTRTCLQKIGTIIAKIRKNN